MPSVKSCLVPILCVTWSVATLHAQTTRAPNGSDADLRQAIIEAESARATTPEAIQPLVAGTQHQSAAIQQLAVRVLGRLERGSLVPNILPLLGASTAAVRAEAANALAQAVQGPANQNDVPSVSRALRDRLPNETDPMVRGVIYHALGRLNHGSPEQVRQIESVLVAGTRHGAKDVPLVTLHGIARGLEALYRTQVKAGPPSAPAIERLKELVGQQPMGDATARGNAARVRQLALTALQSAGAVDVETLRTALKDSDVLVRKVATSFFDSRIRPRYSEEKANELTPFIADAVKSKDVSPLVRYEVVQAYGGYLRDTSCTPLIDAAADANTLVAQAAIDALGRGCPAAEQEKVAAALRRIAETLPANAVPSKTTRRADWHRAAHALVSLATAAPAVAKEILPRFISHPVWQVRMYAARAAAALNDAVALRSLADDSADNVRAAVIGGLSRVTQHADDKMFIASLSRTDHSVIQGAARALQGSPDKAEANAALVAALKRLTALNKDNTRDARVAILQRLQELGGADQASDVMPLLKDFDPRVAMLAAETLTKWTGTPHKAAPSRPKTPVPVLAEVMKLETTPVRVTMKTGGTFELRLYPGEAPATVDRFARLARSGYYDGLTFHRVVANWVIQGGSRGANEVTGDSPFMIDEVGLRSHTRGTLGISTRGHDTGDAQIFVNLGDNPSLDHTFGVWAEVTRGMDVVDGIVEGDVIERIQVGAPSGSSQ